MKSPSCSLLISTYNRPDALELSLSSILLQKKLPGEIVIADDGSSESTKLMIDGFRTTSPVPVKHVWHEDDGFRKTIILNEAIRQCRFDYIVQIDGDIIVHPLFIEEHLQNAAPGFFIRGSRILLNEKSTHEILRSKKTAINFLSPGVANRLNAVHSPILSRLHKKFSNPNSVEGVIGCNMSFWKTDFVNINGYNNDIVGWGREDSELAARFINNSILKNHVKYMAICFHLYHKLFSRDRDEKNIDILEKTIADKTTWCSNGYSTVSNAAIYS